MATRKVRRPATTCRPTARRDPDATEGIHITPGTRRAILDNSLAKPVRRRWWQRWFCLPQDGET